MKRGIVFIMLMSVISIVLVWLYLGLGSPDANITMNVRLPRLVLALVTGLVLAGVGAVYQMMLVNPLAEPYILGISSGSAFGSILFGVMGWVLLMPLGGFIGASLTMLTVWALAQKHGSFDRSRLLIAGVIAGMFFASGISLLMYLFQKDTMIILGTLMGNLGRIFTIGEWHIFLGLSFAIAVIMIWLYHKSAALDVISGGDVYAGSVGIEVSRLRRKIFILTSILIGIVVSYAGIIGFVGLIIPHAVRFFIPSGQRKIYLASLWSGALFLAGCDLVAQNLAVIELPVGVITAAVGCPVFMWLMLRK